MDKIKQLENYIEAIDNMITFNYAAQESRNSFEPVISNDILTGIRRLIESELNDLLIAQSPEVFYDKFDFSAEEICLECESCEFAGVCSKYTEDSIKKQEDLT